MLRELVIENLPKGIMYEGKLPIRLQISDIKMPSAEVGFGLYCRTCCIAQPCEITIYDYYDELTYYAINKWYLDVFDCASSLDTISNQKVNGKIYEYDKDGNITVSFNAYDIFPIMFNNEHYLENGVFTVTFNVDHLGPLEKVNGYKKESLFIKNDIPTINEILNDSHLSWDEYFANIALLAALRSKDKNTRVGAILVDKNNRIIGTGYNGLPSGIDESQFPTTNDTVNNSYENTKYPYVIHAEMNALCNTTVFDITGSKLYCTLFPCCHCAKLLIQRGVKEIIYLSDKHHDEPEYVASRKLLTLSNVITRKFNGNIAVNYKQ